MHNETRPTSKQLLASWQLIWQHKLNGKPAEIKAAIASHVQLFPKGNQGETAVRTERTLAAYGGDPAAIRAMLTRGQSTLRHL